MKIAEFEKEHRYLSNFWECPVMFDGVLYPSSEAAFQAAKTLSVEERLPFTAMGPKQAKAQGQKVTLRDGWNQMKLDVMHIIVTDKFTRNRDLYEKLMATGDAELIEGNYWHDNYWGTCNCTRCVGNDYQALGTNHLGKILVRVRNEFRRSGGQDQADKAAR